MPDLGRFTVKTTGAEPVFFLRFMAKVSDIREAPEGGNARFEGGFPAVMGVAAVQAWRRWRAFTGSGAAACGSTEGGSLLCGVQGRSSPVGVKGQRPLAG